MNDCISTACQKRSTPRPVAPATQLCPPHINDTYNYLRAIPQLWATLAGTQALLAQPAGYADTKLHTPKPGSKPPANLAIIAMRDIRTDWQKPGDLLNPHIALTDIAKWITQTRQLEPAPLATITETCTHITKHINWAITQNEAGQLYDTLHLIHTQLAKHQPDHKPQHRIRCPHCNRNIRTGPSEARCACTTYTYQQILENITQKNQT